MISITTKTGDKGQSGLANGQRRTKDDLVFEVIGTLDELNSWLGLVVTKLDHQFVESQAHLLQIQDTLFYIGAEVARSPSAHLKQDAVEKLENWQAELETSLADNWHTKFVLPGGTEAAAMLDVTRTVCRRAERLTVALDREVQKSPMIVQYLNRLSDYLYLLRCYVNQESGYQEKKFIVSQD